MIGRCCLLRAEHRKAWIDEETGIGDVNAMAGRIDGERVSTILKIYVSQLAVAIGAGLLDDRKYA